MLKPAPSLLTKILGWFFLNLALVVVVLTVFFAFQPQINLYAIIGQEGRNRLRATGMLISHDLHQTPGKDWSKVLIRHAAIHEVDFVLVLEDGSRFASIDIELPEKAVNRVRLALRRPPPPGRFPPPRFANDPGRRPQDHAVDEFRNRPEKGHIGRKPHRRADRDNKKRHFIIRTPNPTRYWSGTRIPLPPEPGRPPAPAMLLAVSESMTGHGFFFDPLPWMIVAAAIMLLSVLFWIPMVRNITRPLGRMTLATEKIANGSFDVSIREKRNDEIGRLGRAINHMTARLSAFVKGQKRFMGDVAHELGSPIARIQMGLGALEQRVETRNRQRVLDVLEDVDHLSKLVNELLAFSRAEMKSESVSLENIELLPIVRSAIKRETAPAAEVISDIDPEIRVNASAELLTRAFANLIRNAVKYAGDAGPIIIQARKKGEHVQIVVRDNGHGVPNHFLDQLFEPFFRPESSRDRESGGVGLGLAIVKTCIETCNGTVSAANLKPKGFAVTITLS